MEVLFNSSGLGNKLDGLEKNLTDIFDQLNQIETEAKSIRNFWDSPAYRDWCKELERELSEVTVSVRNMNRALLALGEIAFMLAETERDNDRAVEQLP